jgi:hypothetical protein
MKCESWFTRAASTIRRARGAIRCTRRTLAGVRLVVICVTIAMAIYQRLVRLTLSTSTITVSTYCAPRRLTLIAIAVTCPLVHIFTACTVAIHWIVQFKILGACRAMCSIYTFSAIRLACQTVVGSIVVVPISTIYESITNAISFKLTSLITAANTIN